ncbi:MAG: FxsA family protein [Hyphomicrobiales bacterium]
MLFLLIFILVPIIEIAAFIKIGDIIGLWPTLGCIVLTAIVGTLLLRQQGLSVLRQAQGSLQQNQVPVDSVIHGAFLLIAGALLLTPGFFTDAVGFILLVPPARSAIAHLIWSRLKDRVHVHHTGAGPGPDRRPRDSGIVIEGEVVETEDTDPATQENGPDSGAGKSDGTSPWNRR